MSRTLNETEKFQLAVMVGRTSIGATLAALATYCREEATLERSGSLNQRDYNQSAEALDKLANDLPAATR